MIYLLKRKAKNSPYAFYDDKTGNFSFWCKSIERALEVTYIHKISTSLTDVVENNKATISASFTKKEFTNLTEEKIKDNYPEVLL